jgi:tRNA (Thr-GGU) A37 N-methylase
MNYAKTLEVKPIAVIKNNRTEAIDDNWSHVESIIELQQDVPESCLDGIDGTPVLDIKPVFREFLPRGEIRQPEWSKLLMKNYW